MKIPPKNLQSAGSRLHNGNSCQMREACKHTWYCCAGIERLSELSIVNQLSLILINNCHKASFAVVIMCALIWIYNFKSVIVCLVFFFHNKIVVGYRLTIVKSCWIVVNVILGVMLHLVFRNAWLHRHGSQDIGPGCQPFFVTTSHCPLMTYALYRSRIATFFVFQDRYTMNQRRRLSSPLLGKIVRKPW